MKKSLIFISLPNVVTKCAVKNSEFPYFMHHILEENNVKEEMPDCTVEEFYHYYPYGEPMAESSYG
ncbi:MAG: hypothetical protein K2I51_03050, partial [Muribaculaceae bacterium]|nr:hypothetical protein [Muribaculaceae bacterium]